MQRLLLFAKRPRLGRVKTRLVPSLSPEQALALYRAFLIDQLRFLLSLARDYETRVAFDGTWVADSEFAPLLESVSLDVQGPGDLGDRLLRAFDSSATEGASATVIIGVDSPTLPEERVHRAFVALEQGSDGAVAPAEDGGYVLIGLRSVHAELFRDVPWGGPRVCQVTLDRAAEVGIELARLEPWYDVDDERGLRRLALEMSSDVARRRAPATASYMDALTAGQGSLDRS